MTPRSRRFTALAAVLSLAFSPSTATVAAEPEAQAEADLPSFAVEVDRAAYLQARAEYIAEKRGLPHFLAYDPRAVALAALEEASRAAEGVVPAPLAWTELGPAPIPNGQTSGTSTPVSGRVSAIAVDPTDEDIVYVGAAGGGVYRSLNGGTSWTQIFDGAQVLTIGALAIPPSDPTILYVGTGESALSADSILGVGLYRIDDPATTATLSGPFDPLVPTLIAGTRAFTGRAISEILVHPTDPATIFVATATATGGNPSGGSVGITVPPLGMLGLYRSTNATDADPAFTKLAVTTGGSLPPDTSGNLSITDIAIDPTDANTLVAWVRGSATFPNGGAYHSTNALAATPTFTQTYAATTVDSRGELAGNRVGATVTFYSAHGDGSPQQGRLQKSTDGGATWSAFLTGAVNFCNPQCFYDIAVDVHPTNANILNVGGSPTLIAGRSTDGGATFTTNAQSAFGVHVDTHVVAIADAAPTVVYLGTDGGIYRSNDSGITWTPLNNTDFHATQFQSVALHPIDREFLIGGTQDNGTQFRRADGTWWRTDGGDGGYALIDQNAVDTTIVTMYHTYFNTTTAMGFARVFNSTTDAWSTRGCGSGFVANGMICPASAVLFYAPMAIGPGAPNTLYFGSDQLFRSTDAGTTMPPVSQVLENGRPITAIGIAPSNDNVRVAGLRNGRIFATTTGANPLVDWTNAAMPDPFPADPNARRAVASVAFAKNDANTVYVAFGGYGVAAGEHVWKTTNLAGGSGTWAPAGAGIPDVPVNDLQVDPGNPLIVYAATDIGVFATIDGGTSWTPFSAALPRVAVFDLGYFGGKPTVLRAATHGRGIWEIAPHRIFSDDFESNSMNGWDVHP